MKVLTRLAERLGIGSHKRGPSAESVRHLQDTMAADRAEEMRRRAEFEREQEEIDARLHIVQDQARILRRDRR